MAKATSRKAAYPTLSSWEHAKTITVDLDAFSVDFEVPDLDSFIARGMIPNPLLPMAIQVAGSVKAPSEADMTPEDRKAYFDLRCFIIATHLRRPNLVEELGEQGAVAWVAEKMPPGHRDALWANSVHFLAPDEVMRSIRDLLSFRPGEASDLDASGSGEDGATAE